MVVNISSGKINSTQFVNRSWLLDLNSYFFVMASSITSTKTFQIDSQILALPHKTPQEREEEVLSRFQQLSN